MATRFVAGIVVALLAAGAPAAVLAQSTRVEEITTEQADKAKDLGVEGPSEAERIVKRILLSPLLSGPGGVYPWFGSVFGGAGMSAGVGGLKRLERKASLNGVAGISINGSMLVRGTFVAPELWRGMMQVDATADWTSAKDVSFYGIGQNTLKSNRRGYDYNPTQFGGNLTIRPVKYVSVTGSLAYLHYSTSRHETLFDDEVAGVNRSLDFHIERATVAIDTRPSPAYATRGSLVRASLERDTEAAGRPYSFTAQEYEAVQLVPLVREQFVLAFRGLVTLTDTAEGEFVPAVLAPYLGSGTTLRGFANRRFTDRNRALFTGEYRWRPSRYMDMALFLDAGQVSPVHDFTLSDFDAAWGIGMRIHGPTFTALRVEMTRGREGFRLVFAGSQPF